MVETLGQALQAGWTLVVRCAFGKRDGNKSIRECRCAYRVDIQSLVWTRGEEFPIRQLEQRLMCPECRSRRVKVICEPPERRWP